MMNRAMLVLALLLVCASTSANASWPEVAFAYDHGYFVINDDADSEEWHTTETTPWARWNFWIQSDAQTAYPFRLDIASNIAIDESIWHVPDPIVEESIEGGYAYAWHIDDSTSGGDSPCFSLQIEQTVDPGVVFRRTVTPEIIPPGSSTVRAELIVQVIRQPTIGGAEMTVGQAWAQSFAPTLRDGLAVIGCTVVERSGPWRLIDSDSVRGAWMDLYGSQVGNEFSAILEFMVRNTTGSEIRFKPVLEFNWEARPALVSQVLKNRTASGVAFELEGPNGEEFDLQVTTLGQHPLVAWAIEPMQYHGDIWAYWPLVIEDVDD